MRNLLLMWIVAVVHPLPAAADAGAKYREVGPAVFRLETSTTEEVGRQSHGTAFAVRADGLLATNFHVVAEVVNRPGSSRLFLELGKEKVEARVEQIDVRNDLALVRVARPLATVLRLGSDSTVAGEKIYSLGFPMAQPLTIIEGTSNGVREVFPFRELQFTAPLNPGMSGGPIVSETGTVVGVNVAIARSAQSISFGVPVTALETLLARELRAPATARTESLRTEVASQLRTLQELMTTRVELGGGDAIRVDRWNVRRPSKDLDCYAGQATDKRGVVSSFEQLCSASGSVHLDDKLNTSIYEFSFTASTTTLLKAMQFSYWLNEKYNGAWDPISKLLAPFSEENPMLSRHACDEDRVRTGRGLVFLVNHCVRSYLPFPGLYDAEFKAITHDANSALIVRGTFRGFSSDNAWRLVRVALEGVEKR